MNEHPILFSGDMVRAILEGRKTQTRRIVKMPNVPNIVGVEVVDKPLGCYFSWREDGNIVSIPCPYGAPGDRLWVRESFGFPKTGMATHIYHYRADVEKPKGAYLKGVYALENFNWKPSIHMRPAYSRITLEITNVRVERLQDITPEGAIAEGVAGWGIEENQRRMWKTVTPNLLADRRKKPLGKDVFNGTERNVPYLVNAFAELWDSINAKRATWESNPWVWVVEFKKL